MDACGSVLAWVAPGMVRLGPLRLPVFGMFAAAGLVLALSLSRRCAKLAEISAEKLWDAGVFAVIAAYVASRVLLLAAEFRDFVRFPLLMLAVPSLTYKGMLLSGLLVWAYLRWKGMALPRVLDAWAPCAALLYAVLQVGHFVEGTDAGMPTGLPWGVHVSGDTVLGKVHPVQLYAAVFGVVLCGVLVWRLRLRRLPGALAAEALMTGGAGVFLLDMLRQPVGTNGNALLDPGQFVALAGAVAGAALWILRVSPQTGVTHRMAPETAEPERA